MECKWLADFNYGNNMDMADLLPHYIFAVLSDFIEHEWWDRQKEEINIEEELPETLEMIERWRDAWTELKEHHDWFHSTYLPAFKEDFLSPELRNADEMDNETYQKIIQNDLDKEQALEEECDRRAIRVVELRGFMWT